MRPGLFLDRDGVINVDRGFVHRPEDFEFQPGIFELVRKANELDFVVVVVTNQSGIGRGYFDEAQYRSLSDWMCECFVAKNARVDAIYHCAFAPSGQGTASHPWRKPNPGMILQAASDRKLSIPQSVLVGDKPSDMQAGAAAGVGLLVHLAEELKPTEDVAPRCVVVRSLLEAELQLSSWAALLDNGAVP